MKSGNQEKWAGPSEGFANKANAKRSVRDLVTRLGGSLDRIVESEEV